jgi:hypothetical protein
MGVFLFFITISISIHIINLILCKLILYDNVEKVKIKFPLWSIIVNIIFLSFPGFNLFAAAGTIGITIAKWIEGDFVVNPKLIESKLWNNFLNKKI